MRVGVIGTGFGTHVVAPVLESTAGCTVVDVVTPRDQDAVVRLCRRDDVDLVSVHSPPFLHAAHVRLALDAGHHVLCDKPFSRSAAEAAGLLETATQAGVLHFVNFEFRQEPGYVEMKRLLDDGAVGDVEQVMWTNISSAFRVPLREHHWLFERDKGGGWLGAWGSHGVDAIRWWFGDIVGGGGRLRTTVIERPDAEGKPHTVDADDGFSAWFTMESGATVGIDTTSVATASLAARIAVCGSEGVLECVAASALTLRRPGRAKEEIEVSRPRGDDPHLLPMRRWIEVVRDAVHEGRQVSPSFADGLACDRALDLIRAG